MNHNAPLTPRPLDHLARTQQRILTLRQLKEHGVTASTLAERCRPGGPWQQLLPQVFLLHAGPPTGEERLRAALLYAAREPGGTGDGEAMVTGLAALALHRFSSVPPLLGIGRIDVLVPRQRRLRNAGDVSIRRAHSLPRPQQVTGLSCAPVPRALADAVAELDDAETVRRLLTEAVRGGHCEAAAVVRELSRARLLSRPHVVDAVDALLAEGRAIAEGRLYEMVNCYGLPDPVWHVDLRLPGGPSLGGVDAYWPEHAVAVEIDARAPRQDDDALWSQYAQKRQHLEGLGISVVHLTPKKLRDALDQQATVVRTALMASSDRTPAAYVVVTPS
ncbi:hypothetical protein QMK19_06060 [Streptomyces sp. H10-C2]|uniref:hypothetical protein n=1 Tax=unclassified Streptomyces TaxID=2593676 RepID=UPI0024B918B0|nr:MULTISPECIES: hypothetical protein [unclassified Streptomyces]MDJ0340110.1 hypothetical protein [Streptomyces sp. PH10-H1]MDJ0369253.1 hypothetical protein [Streptomyces sp. H10-C2]